MHQLKRLRKQEEGPIKPVGGDKDLKDLKDFKVFKREMGNKEMWNKEMWRKKRDDSCEKLSSR